MKKNLALILALLMLLLPLASCSETTNEEDPAAAPAVEADPAAVDGAEETEDPNARIESGLPSADCGGRALVHGF